MAAKKKNQGVDTTNSNTGTAKAATATGSNAVPRWGIWLVMAITGIIYLRSLQNGFTFMDDDYYILKNPYLRDFSWHGVWQICTSFYNYNYHPLTTLTYLLEFKFFQLNPIPYHATNLLLHLANTWLVYRFVHMLLGENRVALLVAILFAVHPMHVESVAWMSERKGLLYALCYLLALIQYLKYTQQGKNAANYAYALLWFLAAVLSKSAAITLPVLLVAIDLYNDRKQQLNTWMEKLPFFLISVAVGITAIYSQKAGGALNNLAEQFGILNKITFLFAGLSSYLLRAIVPYQLSGIHYYPHTTSAWLPWYYYLSYLFIASLAWLATRNSTYRKYVWLGSAFFLITISVMLQVISVGAAIIAERYTYIPYIGLFLIAGKWLSDGFDRPSGNLYRGAFVTIVALYALFSWDRTSVWKNSDSLFADIIEKNAGNPNNCYVYLHWGNMKTGNGEAEEAIGMYTKALAINPSLDRAYSGRGLVYDELGQPQNALLDYNVAIRLNPRNAKTYNYRGWSYYQLNDAQQAIRNYDTAINLNPNYDDAYNNRGWAYYEHGDTAQALRDFGKAVAANPGNLKAVYNIAAIKATRGDYTGAVADYSYIIKTDPYDHNAYLNRGLMQYSRKELVAACMDWKKAAAMGNRDAAELLNEHCK